jgi:RimJ/RimL family protein N-acetyltransferase
MVYPSIPPPVDGDQTCEGLSPACRGAPLAELATERLRLRQWRKDDREPFAAMRADPVVMEFYPAPSTREESEAAIDRWRAQIADQGWSNWAVELALDEIVSFTALVNRRSSAVMERIGMTNAGEDFEHPAVPEGHPLRPHCLYRIRKPSR